MYKWLETALDYGISEDRYWTMTYAEITREIESRQRMKKQEAKEKASFDYILADLIGRSIARIHSSSNHLPTIAETYPTLFVAEELEEQQQEKKDMLSAIRFRQFAESYNKRKGEANKQ